MLNHGDIMRNAESMIFHQISQQPNKIVLTLEDTVNWDSESWTNSLKVT